MPASTTGFQANEQIHSRRSLGIVAPADRLLATAKATLER